MAIVITEEIMDKVWHGDLTINEVLKNVYYDEIQDRIKKNKIFDSMTPVQMALFDAGVTKSTLMGTAINRSTYSTQGEGNFLVPAYIDTTLKEIVEKNDILKYIVSSETPVQSMVVQSAYVDLTDPDNEKATEMSAVEEGTSFPLATLKLGEQAIRLRKFGRAVEQTYEAVMTFTVDLFTRTLELIAAKAADQQVKYATMVALKGDGNNNPAKEISINRTNIDTDDEAFKKELVNALIDYNRSNSVPATTIVAGGATFSRLARLGFTNNLSNGVSSRFVFDTPQISSGSIKVVDFGKNEIKVGSGFNKNGIILLNKDTSLQKHFLNGSKIREYDQNIRNQTKLGTISEIAGFSKNTPDGVMYVQIEK